MKIASIQTGFIEVPGKISINIFAQGCKKRCKGCQNPELQSFCGGMDVTLIDLESILNKYSLQKWICWLGGDATYQEEDFKLFNAYLKNKHYYICLYTGRFFNEVEYLLDDVDIVIDGEWIKKKGGINSSITNQKIYLKFCGKWVNIDNINKLKEKISSL